MREIKFRAWDKSEMKMYNPDDFPYLNDTDDSLQWMSWLDLQNSEYGKCTVMREQHDGQRWNNVRLAEGCILMQYTGLKDKNGKEIYEGDIMSETRGTSEERRVVEWCDYSCGWSPFVYNGGGEFAMQDCIVIGNIYKNPELLEVEK